MQHWLLLSFKRMLHMMPVLQTLGLFSNIFMLVLAVAIQDDGNAPVVRLACCNWCMSAGPHHRSTKPSPAVQQLPPLPASLCAQVLHCFT